MAGNQSSLVNLEVNEEVIMKVLETEVKDSMIVALNNMGGVDKIITEIVYKILHTKVSSDGTLSKYSSDNKYDLSEIMIRKAVVEAAQEAFKEFVGENKDQIQRELKKQLKASIGTIAGEFVRALEDAMTLRYTLNINVDLPSRRD